MGEPGIGLSSGPGSSARVVRVPRPPFVRCIQVTSNNRVVLPISFWRSGQSAVRFVYPAARGAVINRQPIPKFRGPGLRPLILKKSVPQPQVSIPTSSSRSSVLPLVKPSIALVNEDKAKSSVHQVVIVNHTKKSGQGQEAVNHTKEFQAIMESLEVVQNKESEQLQRPITKRPEKAKPKQEGTSMPYMSLFDRQRLWSPHFDQPEYILKEQRERPKPLDAQTLAEERENIIQFKMIQQAKFLDSFPETLPLDFRRKALIELHALRLLNYQKQLRKEFCEIGDPPPLDQSFKIGTYKREKKWNAKESRADFLSVEQKLVKFEKDKEIKRRKDLLVNFHGFMKEWSERKTFYAARSAGLCKAILRHFAKNQINEKKEQEKNERERMERLMAEDEVGYRKLIDATKHSRLAQLLSQTDEYIESLTKLVKQHKLDEKAKENREIELTKISFADVQFKEPYPVKFVGSTDFLLLPTSNVSDTNSVTGATSDSIALKIVSNPDDSDISRQIVEQAKVDDDEYSNKTGEQNYYCIVHTINEKVTQQASIMVNGQLKEYQIKGLEWLVSLYNNNVNGILADEMGLGKTVQTIALITFLMESKRNYGPYLIVVPLSTLSNWMMEFEKWAPTVVVVAYRGNQASRKLIQSSMRAAKFNVLLTTYEYIQRDRHVLSKIRWKYMIIDEGHRMKNHQGRLPQIISEFYTMDHRLLLTGTPLQNKLPELWALLNFLLPSIFKSCSTFETWFNAPFSTTGEKVGLNEEETILVIRRLHKVLRPFLLRRLKKEVESQLPDKIEYMIKCEMSALQRVLYRYMQDEGIIVTSAFEQGKSGKNTKALMNTIMQLRKLCNHPFLFPQIDGHFTETVNHSAVSPLVRASGKFEVLDRILPKLKASNHRVLIFSQMTQLMTILEDYLIYRRHAYLRLDGGTRAESRGELLNLFNAPDSPYFIFLLSTRAGGLGLNLQVADTVIIYDSDWNPHQDLQAQDRAHRIGQKNEVRVLRLLTVNSVEERILAAARHKLNIDEKVIQAGMFDQKSTGMERKEFLQTIFKQNDVEDGEESEYPDDEAINQMIARSEEEFDLFQKMDIERYKIEASAKPRLSRLMDEKELPEWLLRAKEVKEKLRKEEKLGRGARARNKVEYNEEICDDQWMRLIDEEDEQESPRQKRRRSTRGQGQANSPDVNLQPKRKRARNAL